MVTYSARRYILVARAQATHFPSARAFRLYGVRRPANGGNGVHPWEIPLSPHWTLLGLASGHSRTSSLSRHLGRCSCPSPPCRACPASLQTATSVCFIHRFP